MRRIALLSLAVFTTASFVPFYLPAKVVATSEECRIFEDSFTGAFGHEYNWIQTPTAHSSVVDNQLEMLFDLEDNTTNYVWQSFESPTFDYEQNYVATITIKDIVTKNENDQVYYENKFHIADPYQAIIVHELNVYAHVNAEGKWITNLQFIFGANDGGFSEGNNVRLESSPENLKLVLVKTKTFVKAYYQFIGGNWQEIGKIYIPELNGAPKGLVVYNRAGVVTNESVSGDVKVTYDNLVVKKPNCE